MENTNIRIGYCCINKSLGKDGSFKTMTVKKATSLSEDKRFKELQNRTRINFYNLYKIMKWNALHGIKMYRVSSDMCPLYTHTICNYDFTQDTCVLELCDKIRKISVESDIRLAIHPSQYVVVNSEKEEVFQNAIIDLEYHHKLVQLLNIDVVCLHIGGKAKGIEAGKQRFIDGFNKLPKYIQNMICLENDDKSYNLQDTLDLCERINVPMIFDWHHDRVLPSENHCSEYIDRIINIWSGRVPVSHISSSKDDDKIIRSHHDYIHQCDFEQCLIDTQHKFDVEFECKQKDLALINLNIAK